MGVCNALVIFMSKPYIFFPRLHTLRTFFPEPEARETWRAVDEAATEQFKKSKFSEWDFGVGELVKTSHRMIRVRTNKCIRLWNFELIQLQFGMYDRPELDTWHKGRVIVVGDAAHPTTPVSANSFPLISL